MTFSRWLRRTPTGMAQHVMNRGNRKSVIFHQTADRVEFLELLVEAAEHAPVKVGAFALMNTHFHLVLLPEEETAISAYMQWLMNAHIRHYRRRHGGRGQGHIYQGRFKNVPLPSYEDIFRVTRYVEANARRAGLVTRAEDWPWCSLATTATPSGKPLVCPDVFVRPPNWLDLVNTDLSPEELRTISSAVNRGVSLVEALSTARAGNRGRPPKWRGVAATN